MTLSERTPSPGGRATRRATVLVTSLAAVLTTLDVSVVTVALPDVAADLGTDLTGVSWTVSGYSLAFAALLLPAGSWSDRLGRRAVFGLGVAVFTASSALAALSGSIGLLVAARVVQGAAGALVLATALALVAATHTGRDRDRAIATFSAAGALAVAAGPTVGGLLVSAGGWPWIFWVNVPIGALVLAATLVLLPEPGGVPERGRLDVVGAVLATGGLFALDAGLLAAPEQGLAAPVVVGPVLLAAVALAAFVAVARRRGEHALVDLALFGHRALRTTMLLAFVLRVATVGLMPTLVLWLQGVHGLDAVDTGLALLALTVPVAVAAASAHRVSRRLGPAWATGAGFLATAGGALLLLAAGPEQSWTAAVPAFLVLGTGSGLSFAPLMSTVVAAVTARRAGTAAGVANTLLPLGSVAGVALFGAVLTARTAAVLDDATLAGLGVGPGGAPAVRSAVVTGRLAELEPALLAPARAAFTSGLTVVAVLVAVLAAVAAVAGLPPGRATVDGDG